jgi:hypothetical protein
LITIGGTGQPEGDAVHLEKQLSVQCRDKNRDLERMFKVLKKENISLRAIDLCGPAEVSLVRIVADFHTGAKKALKKAGFWYSETNVVGVEVGDSPGALEFFIRKMVEDKITINYAYGSIGSWGGPALIVMHIDNPEETLERVQTEFAAESKTKKI